MTRGPLLKELARRSLGENYASRIWKRVEFIGDLAVIRVPFNFNPHDLRPIAEEILRRLPYIKSVWAALPGIVGEYRLRRHVWLAGEQRSETLYKEHGCLFKVDINRVYISPSLNYEHKRIASLVRPGEVVINMFAGAGLFSIIIAKHARPHKVYSIDISQDAYNFMLENVKLNKVEGIVIPLLGDAKDLIENRLRNVATRVLMPYPELALDYLVHAISSLSNRRGFIHLYLHVKTSRGEHWKDKAQDLVATRLSKLSVNDYDLLNIRKVRNVGPRTHQVAVDLYIK